MRKFITAALLVFIGFTIVQAESDSTLAYTGSFKIDSIQYDIGDVFSDSKVNSKYDGWVLRFLSFFHITSKESTIRKLLLFNEGDVVDGVMLQEAERHLRKQPFITDAKISLETENGMNIAKVKTSDNFTFAVPITPSFEGDKMSFDNVEWGSGLQESNFLGLGQTLCLGYKHTRKRNIISLGFADPNFLFRHNKFELEINKNTDGHHVIWAMQKPFLSRNTNQWAYTIAGSIFQRDYFVYGSGKLPPGFVPYEIADTSETLWNYNDTTEVPLLKVKDYEDDSLSFRLSRSFGNSIRKLYIGASYDYRRETAQHRKMELYPIRNGDDIFKLDSNYARNEWLPETKDSRLGLYLKLDNIRYHKAVNLHGVKWTEDIAKGYTLKVQISKNFEQLGASNNDVRFDFLSELYLGAGMHHLSLQAKSMFYLDHWENIHDFYGKIYGEYIFHPTSTLSTAFTGLADFYKDTKIGNQLYIGGGNYGQGLFPGLPEGYYAGQARVYGSVEQRLFLSKIEVLTFTPIVSIFGSLGETAWDINDINRKDMNYMVGACAYFAQTKTVSHTINRIGISFPLDGARKGKPHFIGGVISNF